MGSRLVLSDSVWIVGLSCSGKTTRLIEYLYAWIQSESHKQEQVNHRQVQAKQEPKFQHPGKQQTKAPELVSIGERRPELSHAAVLVLAANDDNRRELVERIVAITEGKHPVRAKSLLGFFQDEVILFWPLLIQLLNLKAQFPVRLRPETEQELATSLWRPLLNKDEQFTGISEHRLVRRILDLLQLSAYSGLPIEGISGILEGGFLGEEDQLRSELEAEEAQLIESLLLQWRSWCLERGLLTYGIITDLYCQHLLPDQHYQQHLIRRYRYVIADDVDDYPAIARHLFDFLLDSGAIGAFTYNPDGGVRLGLGADPNELAGLAARCRVENLSQPHQGSLADTLATPMVELLSDPTAMLMQPQPESPDNRSGLTWIPETIQSIQTTSRAALLRQTAEVIIQAIQSGQVQPQEVAVIAPGLDAIARYTLVEILTKQDIPVQPLNDQRPLISSPAIRSLLTLLALVYPGLGRMVERDAIAEMLVVLSTSRDAKFHNSTDAKFPNCRDAKFRVCTEIFGENSHSPPQNPELTPQSSYIDPVRAGLLADHCFEPHPDRPNLLSVTAYDRWDRLGYAATTAYTEIVQWLQEQRSQQEQRLIPSPILVLDRAIQKFLWKGSHLPYEQLAALRELLETAQHYWEVDTRLRQLERASAQPGSEEPPAHTTIAQFIQLLRRGTISANPYPVRPIGPASRAVTLATIFQYRSSRRSHRWQFWLDAGSPLWLSGGAATLFGAPLFLQHRLGRPWTVEEATNADEERLKRIVRDLLGRVGERVYLCHSDLAVSGQEQTGPLLSLINATVPLVFAEP